MASLIRCTAIAAIVLVPPRFVNGAEKEEPRLPNPQWISAPHTRSAATEQPQLLYSDSILPLRPASFEERCAQGGVVLCDPLDEGHVRGAGITGKTPNATLPDALAGHYRDWRWCSRVWGVTPRTPVMDTNVKTSGSGALKFVIPTHSAAGDAGYCQINFTPDNSVQFGEGDTFFVQFRVRLSCTLVFIDCDPASPGYKKERRVYRSKDGDGTSFKISIINAGDRPELLFPVNSCTNQHLVLVQGPNGIVAGYHSCGWYDPHQTAIPVAGGGYLWDAQPRNGRGGFEICSSRKGRGASPGCVLWPADEWVTITQQVTIGKWVDRLDDPARNSNVRIWMQRRGEPPVIVIDYDRNLRAPEQRLMKYGKIWLLPYMTDKDPREDHPEAYMWFDELIVSRRPIPPALD